MFICKKKLKLINIARTKHFEIDQSQQLGKKMVASSRFAITKKIGSTNPYKHRDETQQWFVEDLGVSHLKFINMQ
jgi:hypothetical protein